MILIYTEQYSSRLDYILAYLFNHITLQPYKCTDDLEYALAWKGSIINYSNQNIPDAFQILPGGFLFERGIRVVDPVLIGTSIDQGVCIPNSDGEISTQFDVFDALFFFLSRFEEYVSGKADKHGRFHPKYSWAVRHKLLRTAFVDRWVNELLSRLVEKWPSASISIPKFSFVPSMDVDFGYMYRGKGIIRIFGGLLKDVKRGRFSRVKDRLATVLGFRKDEFDIYEDLYAFHAEKKLQIKTFILNAGYSRYDRGLRKNSRFVRRISDIAHKYDMEVGIHPSYRSHNGPKILEAEVKGLARTTKHKVKISRQHFLKFYLPKTFTSLMKLGVEHDYSMGYAQHAGFRASTSRSFLLYDLNEERGRNFTMHPSVIMEGTYFDYEKMQPDAALTDMKQIVDEVKSVGGQLVTIWHEQQLTDYSRWRRVYYELVDYIL